MMTKAWADELVRRWHLHNRAPKSTSPRPQTSGDGFQDALTSASLAENNFGVAIAAYVAAEAGGNPGAITMALGALSMAADLFQGTRAPIDAYYVSIFGS